MDQSLTEYSDLTEIRNQMESIKTILANANTSVDAGSEKNSLCKAINTAKNRMSEIKVMLENIRETLYFQQKSIRQYEDLICENKDLFSKIETTQKTLEEVRCKNDTEMKNLKNDFDSKAAKLQKELEIEQASEFIYCEEIEVQIKVLEENLKKQKKEQKSLEHSILTEKNIYENRIKERENRLECFERKLMQLTRVVSSESEGYMTDESGTSTSTVESLPKHKSCSRRKQKFNFLKYKPILINAGIHKMPEVPENEISNPLPPPPPPPPSIAVQIKPDSGLTHCLSPVFNPLPPVKKRKLFNPKKYDYLD